MHTCDVLHWHGSLSNKPQNTGFVHIRLSLVHGFSSFIYLFPLKMVQPDSPAELGGKIYEMMAIALGGRWGRLDSDAAADSEVKAEADSKANPEADSSETSEPEVVQPSEVRTESDPWRE